MFAQEFPPSPEEELVSALAMKVAGELGEILKAHAGVVREAKRVVRLRYSQAEWEELNDAIAALAGELEKASGK